MFYKLFFQSQFDSVVTNKQLSLQPILKKTF